MFDRPLVGHLACGGPFLEQIRFWPNRTANPGARPTQSKSALASTLSASGSSSTPFKWGRMIIPTPGNGLQPANDLFWRMRSLSRQTSADQNALDRLGHV